MSEKDISKIQINDSLYHLMDNDAREQIVELSGKLIDLEDYSAFEVYAHDTDIPIGALDTPHLNYIGKEGDIIYATVPSSMTETFMIRSEVTSENQDVIVNWGDGATTDLKTIEPLAIEGGEYRYTITHTYANVGTYTVSIYGTTYYGFMTSNDAATTLLSRIFDADLPIAPWIWNVSSMAKRAPRLLHVNFYSHSVAIQAVNWSNTFSTCDNLLDCYGFTSYNNKYTQCDNLFASDRALISTDFRLPTHPRTITACSNVFTKCSNLVADIASLFPTGNFHPGCTISLDMTFRACYKLTGTVPAEKLWNDSNVTFINISQTFEACKSPIIEQAPLSWGGTASDDIIEKSDSEKIAELTSRLEALEAYIENNPSITDDTLTFE